MLRLYPAGFFSCFRRNLDQVAVPGIRAEQCWPDRTSHDKCSPPAKSPTKPHQHDFCLNLGAPTNGASASIPSACHAAMCRHIPRGNCSSSAPIHVGSTPQRRPPPPPMSYPSMRLVKKDKPRSPKLGRGRPGVRVPRVLGPTLRMHVPSHVSSCEPMIAACPPKRMQNKHKKMPVSGALGFARI